MTEASTETRTQTQRPPLYKVLLLNDDYTPMDYVVRVLVDFFRKSPAQATRIMMAVHQEGSGVCGVYPFEVAETKVHQVNSDARQHGFPLKCIMEAE